jgi:cell division protein FtsW
MTDNSNSTDLLRMTWRENPTGLGLQLVAMSLLALGVVIVHSAVASVAEPGPWYARRDYRHTAFAIAAALVLLTAWRFNYRILAGKEGKFPVFPAFCMLIAMGLGLLVYLPAVSYSVGGKFRWIRLGPREYGIGFQPSELIEMSMIVFLSAWLSRRGDKIRKFWRTFVPTMLLTLVCVGLIIREDFGTSMLIGISAVTVMFLAGVPFYYLLSLAVPAAGAFYVFVVRDAHRWGRILAMIDPWSSTNAASYQAGQSLLTVMTGGYFGRGLGQGMLKRGYLPEGTTDFIFSVFCEEWGLVGAMMLISLLLLWIWHARKAAVKAEDPFGRMLAGSLGFMIALQALLHIAVDLVAAPPTGIGCPFISAGGTRLLTMSVATALILSVTTHRRADRLPDLAARPAETDNVSAAEPGSQRAGRKPVPLAG